MNKCQNGACESHKNNNPGGGCGYCPDNHTVKIDAKTKEDLILEKLASLEKQIAELKGLQTPPSYYKPIPEQPLPNYNGFYQCNSCGKWTRSNSYHWCNNPNFC